MKLKNVYDLWAKKLNGCHLWSICHFYTFILKDKDWRGKGDFMWKSPKDTRSHAADAESGSKQQRFTRPKCFTKFGSVSQSPVRLSRLHGSVVWTVSAVQLRQTQRRKCVYINAHTTLNMLNLLRWVFKHHSFIFFFVRQYLTKDYWHY